MQDRDAAELHEAGSTQAGPEAGLEDAAFQSGVDAGPLPQVDAGFTPSADPTGNAYAETSIELVRPAALKSIIGQARELLGHSRLFVQEYRASGQRAVIEYGSADAVSSAEMRWQFPSNERFTFWASPSQETPSLYRSEPFTYRMRARIQVLIATSYVTMTVRDAVYEAQFSADFLRVEAGSLKGSLTRSTAEDSPLGVELFCTQYCPAAWCAGHTLGTLADLLDCNDATMDVDRNDDGTKDAYAVEFSFAAERVLLAPHPQDQ